VTGPSEDRKKDCLHWHGRLLTGDKAHWCPDWDFMPIDDTMTEFLVCTCELGKNEWTRDQLRANPQYWDHQMRALQGRRSKNA